MDVAKVGGKPCKQRLDFDSLPIPIDKGRHRETVAKVMWPGTAPRRAWSQPRFAHEAEKRQMEVAVEDPRARRGEEERVGARLRAELVPALGIGAQRFDGALIPDSPKNRAFLSPGPA